MAKILPFANLPTNWQHSPAIQKQSTVSESICTRYSKLSGRPDNFLGSGTFKKLGTLLFSKSRVQKYRVNVIQKEKRPGCLFSFWITMTLVFCSLLFSKSKVFKTRIMGAYGLGEYIKLTLSILLKPFLLRYRTIFLKLFPQGLVF